MTRPTRANAAGRAYLDLQKMARAERRPTDELIHLYTLEGFLSRLSTSKHARNLTLKGGVLLSAFGARRPTKDIDFHAKQMNIESTAIADTVKDITSISMDDGIIFDCEHLRIEPIRETEEYGGVRISLRASLSRANIRFHIDLNIGDPISPGPLPVALPKLLGGTISLSGYPIEMVFAEKALTALARGITNTRWRDFADMHILSNSHAQNGSALCAALEIVANHRNTKLEPFSLALAGFPAFAQNKWSAWKKQHALSEQLPESFENLLKYLSGLLDPALNGVAEQKIWNPETRAWNNDS